MNELKAIQGSIKTGKVDSAYRKMTIMFGERTWRCIDISLDGKIQLFSYKEKAER